MLSLLLSLLVLLLPHVMIFLCFVRQDGLALCFYNGMTFRRDVLVCVLQHLERILRWMRRQTRYHFYCSSILIVYEGSTTNSNCPSLDRSLSAAASLSGHRAHCRHFIEKLRHPLPHPQAQAQSASLVTSTAGSSSDEKEAREFMYDNYAERVRKRILQHPCYRSAPAASSDDLVHVRIIDLAHTVPSPGTIDAGYVHGLKNVIGAIEEIIAAIDADSYSLTDRVASLLTSAELSKVTYF